MVQSKHTIQVQRYNVLIKMNIIYYKLNYIVVLIEQGLKHELTNQVTIFKVS